MRPLLVALALVLAAPPPCAQATVDAEIDAFLAHALDRFDAVPGLAVAVVRDGETVFARGYGWADREAGVAATADTPFYIASATKPFVALLAALLDHEGALALDATLAELFPDVAFAPAVRPDAVTVRHLLSHTAGVENGPVGFRAAYTGQHTPAVMRALLETTTANDDAPLGAFEYTNVGYNVLSLRLDEDAPWQRQLADRIFEPLGMTRTTAVASEAEGAAAPYRLHPTDGTVRVPLVKHDDTMQAAGGMLASAADLARWLAVHLDGGRLDGEQVLPAEVVAATHAPVATGRGDRYGPFERDGYALGWHTGTYDGEPMLHHFGGFAGFHTHTSFMPTRGTGVVVLANEADVAGRLVPLLATAIYDAYDAYAADDPAAVLAEARGAVDRLHGQFEGVRARMAASLAERAERTWQLSLAPAAYAGTFSNERWGTIVVEGDPLAVRFGRLHAVATPFTEPETVRVELVPGRGQVVGFEVEGGRAVAATWRGATFERVE